MLYHLFKALDFSIPGSGAFNYITFRAGMALFVSLIITLWFGGGIIRMLRRMQVGETVRDLGLEGQIQKQGTPTMGGLMIIAGIVIPTLLFARLNNVYILLLLASVLWLGTIGFIDDYIKVFKKDKRGLAGTSKIIGQIGIGLVVGLTVYFHPSIRTKVEIPEVLAQQFDDGDITRYQDNRARTTSCWTGNRRARRSPSSRTTSSTIRPSPACSAVMRASTPGSCMCSP